MKTFREFFPYVIVIVAVILFRTFIMTPVRVNGDSMVPTLLHKQILILNKLDKSYNRFDIVAIKYGNEKIVKRIIGLPGEHIQYRNSVLYIGDDKVSEPIEVKTDDFRLEVLGYSKIPDGYYLVLGDNRSVSIDSRAIGLISKDDILGVTTFRLWPLNKLGKIEK